MRVFWRIL